MSIQPPIAAGSGAQNAGSAAEIGRSAHSKFDGVSIDTGDGAQFRAALERHMNANAGMNGGAKAGGSSEGSLSDRIMTRASDLATNVKKDQQHVSTMLEQATRTGDSMQLMKAMMALNEYQMRVQFISKTVSKATSSLDQLTKLQ